MTDQSLDDFLNGLPDADDPDFDPAPPPDDDPAFQVPRSTLPRLVLAEALTPRDRRQLRGSGALAVVVSVPSPAWAVAVDALMTSTYSWGHTISQPSPSSRSTKKREEGGTEAADALGHGARVLGVSHAVDQLLPASFVGAADLRIEISAPSNRAIAAAIRCATGSRPRGMPAAVVAGLDLDDLCAAIRIGTSAASCVRRIAMTSSSKSSVDASLAEVPLLSEMSGYGDAMVWATRLVDGLAAWRANGRDPADFARLDKQVCLASAPGLGKTTLVRSIAKTANVPLVVASVGGWFSSSSGYLDGIIKAIDASFQSAVVQAPAILFLDELDALPSRSRMNDKDSAWWGTVLTHVLTTLDGAVSGAIGRIIVVGATNHAARLDPALVRPGRLRVITIDHPSVNELAAITRQHLGTELAGEDLTLIGTMGAGATGADAAGWVKAARLEARAAGRGMCMADLLAQVAPDDDRNPTTILQCARHEISHALATELLRVGRVLTVTLVATSSSGGRTITVAPPLGTQTRDDIERTVVVALAGRCAEELWGDATSGAGGSPGSDLAYATALLAMAHASLGLGDSLLYRAPIETAAALLEHDPELRATVESDLLRLHGIASAFVRTNRDLIDDLAHRLTHDRVMDGALVREMISAAMPGFDKRGLDV